MVNDIAPTHWDITDGVVARIFLVESSHFLAVLSRSVPTTTSLTAGYVSDFPQLQTMVVARLANADEIIMRVDKIEDKAQAEFSFDGDGDIDDFLASARVITLKPLGTLTHDTCWTYHAGIHKQPTAGTDIRIPSLAQIEAIESAGNADSDGLRFAEIVGRASQSELVFSPDKLLARHLAVLGNTGSGKSTTVATIIAEVARLAQEGNGSARVVIFDQAGEYRNCFAPLQKEGKLEITNLACGANKEETELTMPWWLWSKEAIRNLLDNPATDDYAAFFDTGTAIDDFFAEDTDAKGFTWFVDNSDDYKELKSDGYPHANATKYVNRIAKTILREDFQTLTEDGKNSSQGAKEWYNRMLGFVKGKPLSGAHIAILDLSTLPSEFAQFATGAIAENLLRFHKAYWSVQREQKQTESKAHALPTLFVFEEAHNYLPVRDPRMHATHSPFEKLALEGRKYGISVVLSTQRPSLVAETVLAQCGNFLVHRTTNERDFNQIRAAVPELERSVLGAIPNLPAGECMIIGTATPYTRRLRIMHERGKPPHSNDPPIAEVWSGKRTINVENDSLWAELEKNRNL